MKDLMKPRYKVIADYPGSSYEVGDILKYDNPIYKKYPHLFKPLQWWEEREEYFWSDSKPSTPLFVSNIGKTFYGTAWGIDLKTGHFTIEVNGESSKAHLSNYLPATESAYLQSK